MQRKATKDEAAKFIAQCGDAAYEQALEAERAARRQRNMRLARFLEKVARRIALDSAMCGRLRVGKDFLRRSSIGRCGHVFGLLARFT